MLWRRTGDAANGEPRASTVGLFAAAGPVRLRRWMAHRRTGLDLAEVGLADGVVGEQLGARALQDQPARLEDVGAVGHPQRQVRVLLDQEHDGALPVDLPD